MCFSQISYTSWSNNFMQINSYNGNTNPDGYTATFEGNGNFNIPNWRLSAKLKQPITSDTGGYTFPANKVSFQPISTTGQAMPGPVPTIGQIGIPATLFLQENTEVFLVPRSNAPFYNLSSKNGAYYNLQLKFSITLAGGAYLGNYPSWITFSAPVQFVAYDQNNNVIGRMDHIFRFQMTPLSGVPPTEKVLSLQVSTNAVNGLLEFKNIQDYINGTNVTYTNGLTIKSNTDFQINVRSVQNTFSAPSGSTLPLNTVQMTLLPKSANSGNIFPIYLASSLQTIAKGSSSQNSSFVYDIKYFTAPNEKNLIDAKADEYSTTLQYEITPQ